MTLLKDLLREALSQLYAYRIQDRLGGLSRAPLSTYYFQMSLAEI